MQNRHVFAGRHESASGVTCCARADTNGNVNFPSGCELAAVGVRQARCSSRGWASGLLSIFPGLRVTLRAAEPKPPQERRADDFSTDRPAASSRFTVAPLQATALAILTGTCFHFCRSPARSLACGLSSACRDGPPSIQHFSLFFAASFGSFCWLLRSSGTRQWGMGELREDLRI